MNIIELKNKCLKTFGFSFNYILMFCILNRVLICIYGIVFLLLEFFSFQLRHLVQINIYSRYNYCDDSQIKPINIHSKII